MTLSPALTKALTEFEALDRTFGPGGYKLSDFLSPEKAKNHCSSVASSLCTFLQNKGLMAQLVAVQGLKTPPTHPSSAYPSDYDWGHFGHTVVVCEGWWIDYTARQISMDYIDFPYVEDARTALGQWKYLGYTS